MMDPDRFWSIIEQSRRGAKGIEEQCVLLAEQLRQLSPEELVEFQERFDDFRNSAYVWDLWTAAFLIGGACSDHGFEDFRAWLIAQGGDTFRAILKSPDSLADLFGADGFLPDAGSRLDETQHEETAHVAAEVWYEKTRIELDVFPPDRAFRHGEEPSGIRCDHNDPVELRRRFPRLWERFGW